MGKHKAEPKTKLRGLELSLKSSRDSIISVERVQEEGPLANAPPPPSTPGPKGHKVSFGSENVRYKVKRTDSSSSDGSTTPR